MSTPLATDHVHTNRRYWEGPHASWFGSRARRLWACDEPVWGTWNLPQSQLPVLPAEVAGVDAVELGCGTAYVSSWLVRRGARVVGLDISAPQLATARAMQAEFDLSFPLIQADAEHVPLRDGCADLVISEFGAGLWCDPYRWVPEASRLLRPGGQLIIVTFSALLAICRPDRGSAQEQLARDLFGLGRCQWPESDGVEFYLSHGQWIRLLRAHRLQVVDLIEVQAPAGADSDFSSVVTADWARRWPAEDVWIARRV